MALVHRVPVPASLGGLYYRLRFLPALFGFDGGKLRMDERIDLSMSDPDLVPLLIQENYLNYRPSAAGKDDNGIKRMNLIARAAESIADGDIINVQIRRYRQWQLSQTGTLASCIIPENGTTTDLEAGWGRTLPWGRTIDLWKTYIFIFLLLVNLDREDVANLMENDAGAWRMVQEHIFFIPFADWY